MASPKTFSRVWVTGRKPSAISVLPEGRFTSILECPIRLAEEDPHLQCDLQHDLRCGKRANQIGQLAGGYGLQLQPQLRASRRFYFDQATRRRAGRMRAAPRMLARHSLSDSIATIEILACGVAGGDQPTSAGRGARK